MTKRLLKRHKRQVSRAKARVRTSEPDVRTPEQIRAAREASRPTGAGRNGPVPLHSGPASTAHAGPSTGSVAKGDG
jgi:hypothetical protein